MGGKGGGREGGLGMREEAEWGGGRVGTQEAGREQEMERMGRRKGSRWGGKGSGDEKSLGIRVVG